MNPFKDFSLDEIPFEVRYDPLTGQSTRIFDLPYRPIERPDFDELVRKSREMNCPFCPESLEKATPLYPEDLVPEGRIRVGEACIVPNLLPLDRYTGVCVISHDHYIALKDFTPEKILDAFRALLALIRQIAERDRSTRFFNINWNYMPPAGSSIIHPHIQMNCGEIPTRQQRLQMEASHRHFLETGRTFWEDFMEAEREAGTRLLAEPDGTFWTMGFAPQSALPDLWCIFKERSSLLEFEEGDLGPFLQGLSAALRYFDEEGLYSFNVAVFSGRENDHFRVNARVAPRLLLREIGNSDQTYFQVLHREPCSMKPPESVRDRVRDVFRDCGVPTL
jgi:galactose-1-phosphate uridylyltransferase